MRLDASLVSGDGWRSQLGGKADATPMILGGDIPSKVEMGAVASASPSWVDGRLFRRMGMQATNLVWKKAQEPVNKVP